MASNSKPKSTRKPKSQKSTTKIMNNDHDPLKLENDEAEIAMAKQLAMSAKRKLGYIEGSSLNNGLPTSVEEVLEFETGKKTIKLMVKGENDDTNKDGQDDIIWFKIEPDVPLRWLIIQYCDRAGLDSRATRFDFKGVCLRENDTPKQLAMINEDVIYAFSSNQGVHGRTAGHYATLCVRMHNGKDTFLRVRSTVQILHELKRCLLCEGVSKELDSVCFVYNGMKLTQDHTAENLNMEDGDVIDAFDFVQSSSSLAIIGSDISVKLSAQTGKKAIYRMNPDTTPFIQLMKVYAKFESLDYQDVRFIHCGRQVESSKTPKQYGVKDGDTIDVILRLTGC